MRCLLMHAADTEMGGTTPLAALAAAGAAISLKIFKAWFPLPASETHMLSVGDTRVATSPAPRWPLAAAGAAISRRGFRCQRRRHTCCNLSSSPLATRVTMLRHLEQHLPLLALLDRCPHSAACRHITCRCRCRSRPLRRCSSAAHSAAGGQHLLRGPPRYHGHGMFAAAPLCFLPFVVLPAPRPWMLGCRHLMRC